MAYQDGSRVALGLTEIQEAIQEVNAQLQALDDGPLFGVRGTPYRSSGGTIPAAPGTEIAGAMIDVFWRDSTGCGQWG